MSNSHFKSDFEKYKTLKEIVDDYVKHVNVINDKRIEISKKDMGLLMQEVRAFNLFQQNLTKFEEYGISED